MDDLARGCTCGCVGKLSYDEVFAARTERSHEDGPSGNRTFIRAYLKDNKNSGKKLGYNLHTDDGVKELRPIGFDMLHGFARGYTYRYSRALDRGEVADDPNLGGKRVGTGRPASAHGSIAGDAFADDTIQAMSFRGWWTDLRNDTELMPTVWALFCIRWAGLQTQKKLPKWSVSCCLLQHPSSQAQIFPWMAGILF